MKQTRAKELLNIISKESVSITPEHIKELRKIIEENTETFKSKMSKHIGNLSVDSTIMGDEEVRKNSIKILEDIIGDTNEKK